MLDNGERAKTEIIALIEYSKFIRTGKTDSFADVFVYDFLLQMPQSIQLEYLFMFRGQEHLIKFCFLWIFHYLTAKEKPALKANECLSKYSFQLYKKYVIKYLKLHPEAEGKSAISKKSNSSAVELKKFLDKRW